MVGLLQQILRSAEKGSIEGVVIGVLTNKYPHVPGDPAPPRRVIGLFAAGDTANGAIETALSEITYGLGEQGWKQWYWNRIPQGPVLP